MATFISVHRRRVQSECENGFPIGAHHWLPGMAEESERGLKPHLPVWQLVIEFDEQNYVWEIRTWFRQHALEEFQRDDDCQNLAFPNPLKLRDVQFACWSQVGDGSRHDRVFRGDVVQTARLAGR